MLLFYTIVLFVFVPLIEYLIRLKMKYNKVPTTSIYYLKTKLVFICLGKSSGAKFPLCMNSCMCTGKDIFTRGGEGHWAGSRTSQQRQWEVTPHLPRGHPSYNMFPDLSCHCCNYVTPAKFQWHSYTIQMPEGVYLLLPGLPRKRLSIQYLKRVKCDEQRVNL